jgi:hypothetical protein
MYITYINSAGANSGSSTVSSQTVNYSPTPGNLIAVCLDVVSTITGLACADNNGNGLVQLTGGGTARFMFYGIAQPGATSYTVTWTTNVKASMIVGEYSGGSTIGVTNQASSGTSTSPALTVTPLSTSSLIIAMIGYTSPTITVGPPQQGTVRLTENNPSANASVALIDVISNGAGVATTVSATLSSSVGWGMYGFEFVPNLLFTPPTITSEFHWGGGDGW